jgi:hypothetical protein
MWKILLTAKIVVLGTAPIAATAADPRPCEYFSAAEIQSVTGVAPARGESDGPDTKEFPGATTWTCGWLVGERYFAARVLRFRSATEATQALASTSQILKSFPEGIQFSAVSGLGEQALWGSSSEEGAIWVVRKGQMVFSVIYAGELKNSESMREPLQRLVVSGLGKLP